MMARLERRGTAMADTAVARWRRRVAEAIGQVPGVTAEIVDDGVVARGRRLKARWLTDARLRWLGGWM